MVVWPLASYLPLTGNWRLELPGSQFIEGAEAAVEIGDAQAALAKEPAQMLFGGALPLI